MNPVWYDETPAFRGVPYSTIRKTTAAKGFRFKECLMHKGDYAEESFYGGFSHPSDTAHGLQL